MTSHLQFSDFYIGWDVGGWHCDRNPRSRDALFVVDRTLRPMGFWRGNLRSSINNAISTQAWIAAILGLCGINSPSETSVTMAIDTPLGWPAAFLQLATGLKPESYIHENSDQNAYLFRETERHIASLGKMPLSSVKDMIGSQSSKGMHVLGKFAPNIQQCGVWADDQGLLQVIETYPAICCNAPVVKSLLKNETLYRISDLDDARICSVISYLFVHHPESMAKPPATTAFSEGWIWFPTIAS